jgi:hypothetical protein
LANYYNKGFRHAERGIKFMRAVIKRTMELGGAEIYRYETANEILIKDLHKAYGTDLLMYIYQLFQMGEFTKVTSLKREVLEAGFDWIGKVDTILVFAECSKEAAARSSDNERNYQKHRNACLMAANIALKLTLRRNGGKPPAKRDDNFCKALNGFYNYLDTFGQMLQAHQLISKYGAYCP